MVNLICITCSTSYEGISRNSKYCSTCRLNRTKEIQKSQRIKHKEKRNIAYKLWVKKDSNKEKVAKRMKLYNKTYKETHTEERKVYRNQKLITDKNYKSEQKLRAKLHSFLRSKKNNFSPLIGCYKNEFKKWIEANFTLNMSWENYGVYWNLDHVIPLSVFDLTKDDQALFCFNWKNTRPILCEKNFSRKCFIQDILIQELKTFWFSKKNSINSILYGISYLPNHSRNCLMVLVNH